MQDNIFEDEWGDENIIKVSGKQLKRALIKKHLGKLCNCKDRTILIDKENRRVECSECGAPLDPFDVLYEMCFQEHMFYTSLKAMRNEKEELEKWLINNRMGKTLREIASKIRAGFLPLCPHCENYFELEQIKSWVNLSYASEVYKKKLLERRRNNAR